MAKAVKKNRPAKGKGYGKFIKWFWILFATGLVLALLVFQLAAWGLFGKMPEYEYLENPQTNLATEIISADGQTLGKFYLDDNRTPVPFDSLPKNLINALVSTEDERYFDHSGIDARGTLRAVLFLGSKGGASTISQQLSKLLFTKKPSGGVERILQKIKEWVIATRLERQYTKEEILAMYLNTYDFINNADGIRSASRIYFGKEPSALRTEESAVLVGMLQNSSLYNPVRRPDLVRKRRNTVLGQMERNGFLTEHERDSLQALDMDINYNPESHREGTATYFRMYLQKFMADWIEKNPKPALAGERDRWNLYLDGLKIYTTIDSRMQRFAEEAVREHMPRLQAEFFHQNTPDRNPTAPFLDLSEDDIQHVIMEPAMKRSERWRNMKNAGVSEKEIRDSFYKKTEMTVFDWKSEILEKDTVMTPMDSIRYYKSFLRTALMSMEPQTGHVKAWVGGIDYKHFQYDNVYQGARQVGSTFKPFVYAAAIDQLRLSPCDQFPDTQYCIEAGKHGNPEPWCPKNSDGKYTGREYTLKSALANSVNTVTAQLIDRVGPRSVADIAHSMGIASEIPEVPSIALGTPDVKLFEMVGAYGTFANQGVYVKPVTVTRIEDKNGTVLYEYVPETKDVLSKEVAYAMVNLMEGVTQGGSGTRLRTKDYDKWRPEYREIITGYPYEFTNPIAGKTGTTQNQSDGWFMGMVPNLVTGVWVGGEDMAAHFKSITYGQGASMALPIWGLYMRKNYRHKELGVSDGAFEVPSGMTIRTDCSQAASDGDGSGNTDDDIDDIDF